MKRFLLTKLRPILGVAIIAGIFITVLVKSLDWGYSVGASILWAVILTASFLLLIPFLCLLYWRLFTPDGREAEKEAQARYEMKKLQRKHNAKIDSSFVDGMSSKEFYDCDYFDGRNL